MFTLKSESKYSQAEATLASLVKIAEYARLLPPIHHPLVESLGLTVNMSESGKVTTLSASIRGKLGLLGPKEIVRAWKNLDGRWKIEESAKVDKKTVDNINRTLAIAQFLGECAKVFGEPRRSDTMRLDQVLKHYKERGVWDTSFLQLSEQAIASQQRARAAKELSDRPEDVEPNSAKLDSTFELRDERRRIGEMTDVFETSLSESLAKVESAISEVPSQIAVVLDDFERRFRTEQENASGLLSTVRDKLADDVREAVAPINQLVHVAIPTVEAKLNQIADRTGQIDLEKINGAIRRVDAIGTFLLGAEQQLASLMASGVQPLAGALIDLVGLAERATLELDKLKTIESDITEIRRGFELVDRTLGQITKETIAELAAQSREALAKVNEIERSVSSIQQAEKQFDDLSALFHSRVSSLANATQSVGDLSASVDDLENALTRLNEVPIKGDRATGHIVKLGDTELKEILRSLFRRVHRDDSGEEVRWIFSIDDGLRFSGRLPKLAEALAVIMGREGRVAEGLHLGKSERALFETTFESLTQAYRDETLIRKPIMAPFWWALASVLPETLVRYKIYQLDGNQRSDWRGAEDLFVETHKLLMSANAVLNDRRYFADSALASVEFNHEDDGRSIISSMQLWLWEALTSDEITDKSIFATWAELKAVFQRLNAKYFPFELAAVDVVDQALGEDPINAIDSPRKRTAAAVAYSISQYIHVYKKRILSESI